MGRPSGVGRRDGGRPSHETLRDPSQLHSSTSFTSAPPPLHLHPSTRTTQHYPRQTDSSLSPIPPISHSCRPFHPFLTPSSRSSLPPLLSPSFHTFTAPSPIRFSPPPLHLFVPTGPVPILLFPIHFLFPIPFSHTVFHSPFLALPLHPSASFLSPSPPVFHFLPRPVFPLPSQISCPSLLSSLAPHSSFSHPSFHLQSYSSHPFLYNPHNPTLT